MPELESRHLNHRGVLAVVGACIPAFLLSVIAISFISRAEHTRSNSPNSSSEVSPVLLPDIPSAMRYFYIIGPAIYGPAIRNKYTRYYVIEKQDFWIVHPYIPLRNPLGGGQERIVLTHISWDAGLKIDKRDCSWSFLKLLDPNTLLSNNE